MINVIPGVVDNGLFLNVASAAVIADESGRVKTITRP